MPNHSPTQIRIQDLAALKQRADDFLLPWSGKKVLTGSGNIYSPFKSRGLDFQEVRVYQPGDDIRQIDWHVTAKYGKPFTKLYTEEKERTIFFIVDLRSSMNFATHGDFKSVIAARLTAFMAFVAEHQKDKIGYFILTDNGLISSGDADKGSLSNLLQILVKPASKTKTKSDFTQAIRLLAQLLPAGSFVFMFSDFHDWSAQDTTLLAPLSDKNTFLFCFLYDSLEAFLPKDSLSFSDGKTTLFITEQDKKIREHFHMQWQKQQDILTKATQKYNWGFLPLATDSDYLNELIHFCFGEPSHAAGN